MKKNYDFNSKQVIDYVNDYVEEEDGCIYLTEEEWYDALGVEKDEIIGNDGNFKEGIEITFDGEKLAFEEQELACSVGAALAKYGAEKYGGKWTLHWCEGAVAAWDKDKHSAGEIWGF